MLLPHASSLRPFLLPVLLLVVGWGSAIVDARALPFAVAAAVFGAMLGTRRSFSPHWRAVLRHALLAASAFAYPLFLGGRVVPWVAAAVPLVLIACAWVTSVTGREISPVDERDILKNTAEPRGARQRRAEWGERLAVPQALIAGLGWAVAVAATQFFFPSLWRVVAATAVCIFLLLLVATLPHATVGWAPSPFACAVVLGLSEGLVVLHQLPSHWAANGALIAAAFAMVLASTRVPRFAFSGVLVGIFLMGVWIR